MERWIVLMLGGLLAAAPIAAARAQAEAPAPAAPAEAEAPFAAETPPPETAPAGETPAGEIPPGEIPPDETPPDEPPPAETAPAAEAPPPAEPPAAEPPAATPPLPAGRTEMGFFRLRRTLDEAETACREGRHAAARDAYLRVLAATRPGQKRRLDALHGLAVADLLVPEPALGEARAALAELQRHGRGERRQQAQALAVLLDRIASAHATAAAERQRLQARLESEQGAALAQLEGRLQAATEAEEASAAELQQLAARLAAAQREIARLEEELARSEHAVERLKKALVEGVGRP